MGIIQNIFKSIDGYLISIERDTENGWYFLKVGIPSDWVFKGNKSIACDVKQESELGRIVDIKPKKNGITIDDLIEFLSLVERTNAIIVEKQKEIDERLTEAKLALKKEMEEKLGELENLKEESFMSFDRRMKNESKKKNTETIPKKKRGRPKKVETNQ
jgi:hypothetical protein